MEVKLLSSQHKFVTSEKKHSLLCGGYGSGKTRGFIAKSINELMDPANLGQTGLIAEPTFQMTRDVLLTDLMQTFDDFKIPAILHRSELNISTAYGNILLRSAENYDRWRGLNLAWGGIDEVAQLKTDLAWLMLISRMRGAGTRRAFASTTPGGFNFVYDLWGSEPSPGYELIKAKTTDNPYLPEDYIESLYQNFSARMVEQYINGDFVVLDGRVYAEYGEENQDDWQYKPGLETFGMMDFGYNRPSILFAQIDVKGGMHIFHEIACRDMITESQAMKMKEYALSIGGGGMRVYCDPAGASHTSGSHYSDVQMVEKVGGFLMTYTTSHHLTSIAAGVSMMQGMLLNGAGVRRLFVNPTACPDAHRSLQAFRYKPNNKSEPLKDGINDHDCDAIRYGIINRFPPVMLTEWRQA